MAVIREQRQFGVSPVRVVRADTGGQLIGQAMAQAGETFSDIMFKRAAVQAEKAGKETALSVEAEKVVTFDPITQKPVAHTPPKPFGTIAAEAYQNVINQRFNQEIESDIKNRGTELALQFKDSANGSELYNQAMQDYVDQLKQNAGGMYGEYISSVGGEYRESTYLKLKQDEQDRARAESKRIIALQHADNVSNAIAMYSQMGPEADAMMPASASIDEARAGVSSYSEAAIRNKQIRQARAAGIVLFSINRSSDNNPSNAQNDLRALAMGTQGLRYIKDPELKEVMSEFAGNESDWEQVYGEISSEAANSIERNILEDTVNAYGLEAVSSFTGAGETASRITTGDIASIGSEVESLIAEKRYITNGITQAMRDGYSAEVAQIVSGANDYNRRVNSAAGALTGNLIRAANSVEEINAASLALQKGSANGLTGDLYDTVSQIVNLSNGIGDEGIINTAVSKLSNISSETAFFEAQAAEQANTNLSNLNNELAAKLAVAAPEDIEGIRAEFNAAASDKGVTNAGAEGDLFDNFVARAHIRFAVDEAVTSSQLSAIETYLKFQRDDNNLLTDSMKANLDAANEYGAKDPSRLNESIGTYIAGKAEQFRLEAQAAEQAKIFNSVLNGSANPNDQKTREIVEIAFGSQLAPENLSVFKNVLPETLYNQFSKFGDGTLDAMTELSLLNQWSVISTTVAPDGTSLKTNSYLSIPAEQRARLDAAITAMGIYGEGQSPEQLANSLKQINNAISVMSLKENVDRVKSDLGGKSIEEFVMSEFKMSSFDPDVMGYVKTRLTIALSQIYSSGRQLTDLAGIVSIISEDLNSKYTQDPYVLGEGVSFDIEESTRRQDVRRDPFMGFESKRDSENISYTMYPLERTTGGYRKEFIDYVSVYAGTTDIKFKSTGFAEDGGISYLVYKRVGNQYLPVSREVLDEQTGESVSVPLMISTNDSMFRDGLNKRAAAEQAAIAEREIAKAQEILTSQNEANALATIISESASSLETQLSSVGGIQAGTIRSFLSGDIDSMDRIYNTLFGYTEDRKTQQVMEILSTIENIRSQIGNQ
jgi:hypothetical protein